MASWTDPESLLVGPRGRRLCRELLVGGGFLGPLRMEVRRGKAAGDPDRLARELAGTVRRTDLHALGAAAEPTAFLGALGQTVSSAMYWQEPDETDAALAGPLVRDALRPVAEAVASAPGVSWWTGPVASEDQYQVVFPGQSEPEPPGDPHEALVRWRAETVADEGAALERPADPTAAWSGRWWSTPAPSELPASTRTLGAPGSVGLSLVEDGADWTTAPCRLLRPRPGSSGFEVGSSEDWSKLVAHYPLLVPRSRRHDWHRTTGQDHLDWAIPDYLAVAEDYDAIHLSVAGYLTTSGRALGTGESSTVLAGWDPDQTWWLTDNLQPPGSYSHCSTSAAYEPLRWRAGPP
ncbi:MAG: hypothetical protein M0T80_08735 [Actinomycetota bacterium]|nr:hypothetical protein [Actinomycetota bacterium]